MDRNTFAEKLQALKQRTPFRPFTVEFVNGDRVTVDRADAVALRHGFGMFLAAGGVPWVLDPEGVERFTDTTDGG